MTAVSILGPYLGITVFTEDDSTVAEKFFNYPPSEKPTQATIRSLTSQFQSEMELLRVSGGEKVTFSSVKNTCQK